VGTPENSAGFGYVHCYYSEVRDGFADEPSHLSCNSSRRTPFFILIVNHQQNCTVNSNTSVSCVDITDISSVSNDIAVVDRAPQLLFKIATEGKSRLESGSIYFENGLTG